MSLDPNKWIKTLPQFNKEYAKNGGNRLTKTGVRIPLQPPHFKGK